MTLSSKHKGIFLLITITILLISITAVSAVADDNTTDTNYQTDSTPVDTITTNDIVTEKQSHNSYATANEPSNTGIIKKDTANNIKEESISYDAYSYSELVSVVNSAKQLNTSICTINLHEGNNYEIYDGSKGISWGGASGSIRTLIINGNGATITSRSTYTTLSKSINISQGYTLTLNNLELKNFATLRINGAAINNKGNLILNDCKFTENKVQHGLGASIYNQGNLNVTSTTFRKNKVDHGYGGGIYNIGNITIINSTFTDNNNVIAGSGGAIYNKEGTVHTENTYYANNARENFIVTSEGKIQQENDDGYINVNTFTVMIDNVVVYTGSKLDDYTLPNGNYEVILTVNGTNTYNNKFKLQANITREDTTLTVDDISDIAIGENITVTGTLTSDSTPVSDANVTVTIESLSDTTTTDSKGKYSLTFTPTTLDTNTAVITVTDIDTKYSTPETVSKTFTVWTNTTVSNYIELVEAVNNAKTLNIDNFTIDLLPGNYNATSSMSWSSATGSIRTLIINGNNLTLDGQNKYRFMTINNGYELILSNVTLTDYYVTDTDSGVIRNNGYLTVIDSTFKNNADGALRNYGNLTVVNSTFMDNSAKGRGGAIKNNGNTNISGSVFINNTAVEAGAINNYQGYLTVSNSLFTNNIATSGGASIYTYNGITKVTDSIFEDNTAAWYGAVFYNNAATLTVTGSVFTNNKVNTGGVVIFNYQGGKSKVFNCTFTNNKPLNFIIDDTTNKIKLNRNDNYISVGSYAVIIDDSEAYNGNNLDDYVLPRTCSECKLIVNGTDTNTFYNNTFILTTVATEINVNNYTELVEAVENAKTLNIKNYTISLLPGDYNATGSITWNNANDNTRTLIINGNGSILDGKGRYQFINIGNDNTLILNNLTLTNYKSQTGGAIYNNGSLLINDTIFTNNKATVHGGAIYNDAILSINNSNFNHNTASINGGVFVNTGNITIENSIFTNNTALADGGVLKTYNGLAYITNSLFTNNTAKINGGVAYNDKGTLTVSDSNFISNTAEFNGGVFVSTGNLSFSNSLFKNNTALHDGGVLKTYDGTVKFDNLSFIGNKATGNGGANYFNQSLSNTIITGTFIDNSANHGGANFFNFADNMILTDDEEYLRGHLNLTIDGEYINNRAKWYGGANYIANSLTNSIINGTYTENTATYGGANHIGDLFINSIIDGTYTSNNATYGGANSITAILKDVNITGTYTENTATYGGANFIDTVYDNLYIDAVYEDNVAKYGPDEYFSSQGDEEEDDNSYIPMPTGTINDNTTDNTTTNNINNDKTGKLQKTYKNKQYMKTTKDNKSNTHSTKTTFKQGTSITLRMLNEIFTQIFNNKRVLIYIGDVLVYNGTLGDDLSEILFTITNDFKGNYSLKVVSDGNTYTKEIEII